VTIEQFLLECVGGVLGILAGCLLVYIFHPYGLVEDLGRRRR